MDQHVEAIRTERLTKRFGAIAALTEVSLSIPAGCIFGLLGPSGSGKTTLIRAIVGALRPTSGTIDVLGVRLPSRDISTRIGYMTQTAALYEELSLRENLQFFGGIYGLRGDALDVRVREIATEVELETRLDDALHTFSGGMRQRSSLAVAMIHSPDLLMLDEPTVGLDPILRATFWDRFRALAGEGRAVIVSSHAMDEAERCERLAFLRDGRVLAVGSPDELRDRTGTSSLEGAFLRLARSEEGAAR